MSRGTLDSAAGQSSDYETESRLDRRRPRWRLGVQIAGAVVGVGTVLTLCWNIYRVHDRYGEWGLTESAAPPRLPMYSRTYERSSYVYHRGDAVRSPMMPTLDKPNGNAVLGDTGGGTILGPAPGANVPTVVYVRTSDAVYTYSLSGGP